jgi:hypothetical protein
MRRRRRLSCEGSAAGGRTLTCVDHEERIALFLDYENLAISARDHLAV